MWHFWSNIQIFLEFWLIIAYLSINHRTTLLKSKCVSQVFFWKIATTFVLLIKNCCWHSTNFFWIEKPLGHFCRNSSTFDIKTPVPTYSEVFNNCTSHFILYCIIRDNTFFYFQKKQSYLHTCFFTYINFLCTWT